MARSRTGAQHNFAQIPSANIQRSVFNRSCGLKTTFNAGFLVPIFCDEALPGDTMEMKATTFGRLATLLHPVMENMWIDYFYFFVPNRLVWANWQKFCGEQNKPGDSTDFVTPKVTTPGGGWPEGSVADYFGIPTKVAGISPVAFHFRAMNLIYNEWFRDENLQDPVPVHLDNGPDPAVSYTLLKRGKRHDYFTSALPWPQKGPAVSLPLGTTAPVIPNPDPTAAYLEYEFGATQGGGAATRAYLKSGTSGSIPQGTWEMAAGGPPGAPLAGMFTFISHTGMVADLAGATAATINEIREAFQIQRMFEKDARGGTRYTELLRSHFGVVSPDSRLQRPEYLGGGRTRVSVNQVASTNFSSASGDEVALGDLGAFAVFAGNTGFRKSFTEHGVILGFACFDADLNYQQGLDRMWSRETRFDFYWPALSHLGEQAILNREIYAQGNAADTQVFGYQERYAEYRYKPSQVTAAFRSSAAASLDSWHLAQEFATPPTLSAQFIVANPPVDRIIAVSAEIGPQVLLDAFFQYRCTRPMPVYGVPGLIDHF